MEFFDTIKYRKSTRTFTDEPVSREAVDQILMAANAAPVGSAQYDNLRISVVESPEIMDKLSAAARKMVEERSIMKKIAGNDQAPPAESFNPFYGAPMVLIVSHKMHGVQHGITYANAGSVCENMQLAATALGLGSCCLSGVFEAMRIYPELDTSSILELPEDYRPVMGLIVGHSDVELNEREIKERIPTHFFVKDSNKN